MLIIGTLILVTIARFVAVHGKKVQVFPVFTDPTADLYKGKVGTLPCRYQRAISSVVWLKGESLAEAAVLISLHIDRKGDSTRSGPGFTRGEFDISDEFSLIIKRVTVEDEGRYYCIVADLENKFSSNNYTDLSVVAFASGPVITPCVMKAGRLRTGLPACIYDASNHTTKFNLTCTLRGFKPDVSLSWRSSGENLKPLYSIVATLADGTLERTVTVELDPRKKGRKNFTCTATGIAVNGTVSIPISILNTDSTVIPTPVVPAGAEATYLWIIGIMGFAFAAVALAVIVWWTRKVRRNEEGLGNMQSIWWKYQLAPLLGENYERKELLKCARKAQKDRRFEDMAAHMVKVVEMTQQLSLNERYLLKEAFYKVVNEQRALLVNLDTEKEDNEGMILRHRVNDDREYREKIEIRLQEICNEILKLLNRFLLKKPTDRDAEKEIDDYVFYLTMKGDYIRYKISCRSVTDKKGLIEETKSVYEEAHALSDTKLPAAHATRLAVSRKLAVFYFEHLHQRRQACAVVRTAIEKARQEYENRGEDVSTERAGHLLILRRYLEYWTNDDGRKNRTRSFSEMEDEFELEESRKWIGESTKS